MKGNLIIISGPSGVGKSTIRKRIIKEFDNFKYSVSLTTRKPRIDEETNAEEENGKEYYFVTPEIFKENIKNNNFLEYQEVYKDTFYGTLKKDVMNLIDNGINVILEIDVDGALNIEKEYNNTTLIFIKPSSLEELENRLRNRNSDSSKKIEERLEKAKYEINKSKYYDYVITSTNKEEDYKKIKNIIKKILTK